MSPDPHTILLVEDNDDDVFIFKRAYKQTQLPHALHQVTNGREALDFLNGEGRFSDRAKYPLPFLVLLDLKLPLKHGLEVLQAIRMHAALSEVCVIVLTSSAEARDVLRAHELGAHAFLVKPPTSDTISAAVACARARRGGTDMTRLKIPGDRFNLVPAPRPRAVDPAN